LSGFGRPKGRLDTGIAHARLYPVAKEKTALHKQLESGKQVLLTLASPPKGSDPAPLRELAQQFAGKVHAIGVSDNHHGVTMSALAAAALIAAEGVEPVLTLTTRDRNRIALLSDCLGAQALGVRNFLCTSGTHQTLGAYSAAKSVFDLDSVQLTQVLTNLCANGAGEERLAGEELCLGGVAAPYADPLEMQVARLAKKVETGARFLVTQPVYDLARFEQWWTAVTERGLQDRVAILAGVEPLADADAAQAEARRRPSPVIPAAVLERLAAGADSRAQRELGIDLAVETIDRLSKIDGLRGFTIGGEPTAALAVIERSGLVID